MEATEKQDFGAYLWRFFLTLLALILFGFLILAPWSLLWLYQSGDAAVERAVKYQASGKFALFGSGISQDFVDYKLRLYAATKPEIIAIGSSRVMQFRGAWFRRPFLNMGGVAGNLAVLRSTIDALLKISRPQAAIIGIDFWWFMPQWEANPDEITPPTSGSYTYNLDSLKKPWDWLLTGKIEPAEFAAPVLSLAGSGFRPDRFGIMAQQSDDGFGPDGSWYYTAEITGQKPALDYQFKDTLLNVERGIRAFFHARAAQTEPSSEHIETFAEIICRLKSRGVQTRIFIPPLAPTVFAAMKRADYPHLFKLKAALAAVGIEALDFSNPKSLDSGDCEFIDGFHGGEITYARILRRMADHWPSLLAYVNMERIDAVIRDFQGRAFVPDSRITDLHEIDFLGCQKRGIKK